MASKTISTTASELIPRNRHRKSFVVQNEDTTIDCFIKRETPDNLTVSTTDHDHRLARETSLSINSETDGKEAIQDRWTIIAASGAPRISYFETEDIVR